MLVQVVNTYNYVFIACVQSVISVCVSLAECSVTSRSNNIGVAEILCFFGAGVLELCQ